MSTNLLSHRYHHSQFFLRKLKPYTGVFFRYANHYSHKHNTILVTVEIIFNVSLFAIFRYIIIQIEHCVYHVHANGKTCENIFSSINYLEMLFSISHSFSFSQQYLCKYKLIVECIFVCSRKMYSHSSAKPSITIVFANAFHSMMFLGFSFSSFFKLKNNKYYYCCSFASSVNIISK